MPPVNMWHLNAPTGQSHDCYKSYKQDRQAGRQTDEHTDRRTDGRTDGQTDKRTDGQTAHDMCLDGLEAYATMCMKQPWQQPTIYCFASSRMHSVLLSDVQPLLQTLVHRKTSDNA